MKRSIIEPKATDLGYVYNPVNKDVLQNNYEVSLDECVADILEGNTIEAAMQHSLFQVRVDSLKLVKSILVDVPETEVSEDSYSAAVAGYGDIQRKLLWDYRRLAIRTTLLATLLDGGVNKKKLMFRVQGAVRSILNAIIADGKNRITLSQAVHAVSSIVSVKSYVTKGGEKRAATPWIVDELALQFINELAEQDYFDLKVDFAAGEKTHMLSLTEAVEHRLDANELVYMSRVSKFLSMQTILTEKPVRSVGMITRRSWWYNTPDFVADQEEFLDAMHDIKYGFVDNAEELIEEAFRVHLKVVQLPVWAKARVSEYQAQIRASHQNGGHYIAGKHDSALRWYFSGEVGHFQTSKELRALVTLKDVPNPVKYDFRNNVVQMYALLSGIKNLANYVGLTSEDQQLGDLREVLAQAMNTKLGVDTFNKENTKPLFMIWAYNAGRKRLMDGVVKVDTDFFTGAQVHTVTTPGLYEIAGLPVASGDDIWSAWESTLNELVPGIVAIKLVFKKLMNANPLMETEWMLPDGAIAQYASVATTSEALHWVSSSNTMHTHTHYRKEIAKGEKNSGVLPRVIHSFDAYVKRQLTIRGTREGIIIVPNHDSFIYDESHKARVDEIVSEIFIELLNSDAMSSVLKELNVTNTSLTLKDSTGKAVTTDRFGAQLTAEDILAGTPMSAEEM